MHPQIGGVRTPGLLHLVTHYPWLVLAALVVVVAVVYLRRQG